MSPDPWPPGPESAPPGGVRTLGVATSVAAGGMPVGYSPKALRNTSGGSADTAGAAASSRAFAKVSSRSATA